MASGTGVWMPRRSELARECLATTASRASSLLRVGRQTVGWKTTAGLFHACLTGDATGGEHQMTHPPTGAAMQRSRHGQSRGKGFAVFHATSLGTPGFGAWMCRSELARDWPATTASRASSLLRAGRQTVGWKTTAGLFHACLTGDATGGEHLTHPPTGAAMQRSRHGQTRGKGFAVFHPTSLVTPGFGAWMCRSGLLANGLQPRLREQARSYGSMT